VPDVGVTETEPLALPLQTTLVELRVIVTPAISQPDKNVKRGRSIIFLMLFFLNL
jgi:hypothetical protein